MSGERIALRRQSGLTLVELMMALTLGLSLVMAAAALLVSGKAAYTAHDEGVRIEESGRYAIESISHAVRQAAYHNWDYAAAPADLAEISAGLAGLDAQGQTEAHGLERSAGSSVNGSDVLALRFAGSGAGPKGDGTMINCAGSGVPQPASLESDRGWSIFYVGAGRAGEPELRCKYLGDTSWQTDAIVRGVESFQVLYGLDSDADGLPNRYLTATAIDGLDASAGLASPGSETAKQAIDRNKRTHWKKVVSLKLALLVRATQAGKQGATDGQFNLFGDDYARLYQAGDPGSTIFEAQLPAPSRNRQRKVFASTIYLRNQNSGGGT